MKHLIYQLPSLVLAFFLLSCETESEPTPTASGDIKITGYKESIYLELENQSGANGRSQSDDFTLSNLSLYLINVNEEIISSKHFELDPYAQSDIQIPDTISFGNVTAGEYQVMVSTIPRYSIFEHEGDLLVDLSTAFYQPMFTGSAILDLNQEVQYVSIDMINKSAKLSLRLSEDIQLDENIYVSFPTPRHQYFSIISNSTVSDESLESGWWWSPGISFNFYRDYYHNEITNEQTLYILPNELSSLVLDYYDYSEGLTFNHQYTFNEAVALKSNQHLTITIDVNAMMDPESSMMALGWVDINWEEMSEIMLP